MREKNIRFNKIIYKVFISIFMFFLLVNIYVIASKSIFDTTLPQIFGYSYIIDKTENMTPTLSTGDMLLFKESDEYNENDIVLVNQNGAIITSRIIEKDGNSYMLKGDNEQSKTINLTGNQYIQGKIVFSIVNGEQIIIYTSIGLIIFLILYNIYSVKKQERLLRETNDIKRLKRTKRYKRNYIPDFIAICLVVTSVMSISSARYTSTATVLDTAPIAGFYVDGNFTNFETVDLTKLSPEEIIVGNKETESFTIDVVNYNETLVSETTLEYSIRLEITENVPITYSIEPIIPIDATSEPQIYVDDFTKTDNGYIAGNGVLPHTDKVNHTYKISISWEEGMYDPKYSKEVDYVKIYIDTVQKD